MDGEHTGRCLCGAVSFRATGPLRDVVYCHCSQCRRQTGHFYAATDVSNDRLEVSGGENITWFRASATARRGFCRVCGSALFWESDGRDRISVLAGSFDEPTGLRGKCHIFVVDKGDYYAIEDQLPQFPASEL